MYLRHKAEIDKRDLSNSENRDKAILSFSSAGLALSLSLIRFVVPIEKIENFTLLYWVWSLFGGAVILTILSFSFSQYALKKELKSSEDYYLNGNENYIPKYIKYIEKFFAIIPTLLFVGAIICIVVFAIQNFNKTSKRNEGMSDTKKIIVQKKIARRGASIPQREPLPKEKIIINPEKKD